MSRDEIVEKLLNHDHLVIDEAIVLFMPLAKKMASKYRFPECLSVANLALVQAVHWCCEGRIKHSYVEQYIISHIKGAIIDFIRRDRVIITPRNQVGVEVIHSVLLEEKGFEVPSVCVQDVLEICHTEREKLVVSLRTLGFTNTEIGSILHCSGTEVWRTVKEIRRKYYEHQ